jgi:hypothetical protein
VATSTVFHVLNRFKKNGFQIEEDKRVGHREFPKIPKPVQSWLLEPETLQAWVGLSLQDRVREIEKEQDGLKISYVLLFKFYRYHKIGFHSTQYIYRSALQKRVELEAERIEFAHQLASLIYASRPIIYLDETRQVIEIG